MGTYYFSRYYGRNVERDPTWRKYYTPSCLNAMKRQPMPIEPTKKYYYRGLDIDAMTPEELRRALKAQAFLVRSALGAAQAAVDLFKESKG